MKTCLYFLLTFAISILWLSCSENISESLEPSLKLPQSPFDYINKDSSRPFSDNELTNNGATLGRVLFYDKQLSLTKNKSCSSCHHQKNAFSDVTAKSEGFKGTLTKRNSLPIFNLRHSGVLFWDNRVSSLEELAAMPIADHIEMGLDDDDAVVSRLENKSYYRELFNNAFGDEEITIDRVASALAQFVRSIQSFQSKFDQGRKNDFNDFSKKELDGFHIFKDSGCENCHLITSSRSTVANIGLEMHYEDKGIYHITKDDDDKGQFKVPSLRNIALTAPYMHDGRFASLNDVFEHYSGGITDHPNLDGRLKTGLSSVGWGYYDLPDENAEPIKLSFTDYEMNALVAFFNTLTDEHLITDEKYSNPFEYH